MKKLQELNAEELKALYKENEQFSNKVYERIYEGNMAWQENEGRTIFGKDNRTIRFHDHYASFYITISDHEHFAESLEGRDSMTITAQELYDKACELIAEWNDMDYDEQDENSELWEQIEKVNCELVEELTDQLRAYEQVDDSQIEDELQAIRDGMTDMSDWETDGKKVFRTRVEVYE